MVRQYKWMATVGLVLMVMLMGGCAQTEPTAGGSAGDGNEVMAVTIADAPVAETTSQVTALTYAPDGNTIYSGHADGAIIRRTADGAVETRLEGHDGEVVSLAVSPDGTRLASIGTDKLTLIQSTDGSSAWAISEPLSQANTIDFSPDGETLAEAYWEKLDLWPVADPSAGATPVEGLEPSIRLARYAPDGTRLSVALSNTGLAQPELIHLDPANGDTLATVTPDAAIETLLYGPGSQVFAALSDEAISIWPAAGERPIHTISLESVLTLGFSPNGVTLLTAQQGTNALTIGAWNVESGEASGSTELSVIGTVTPAFAPDGTAVAIGHDDGSVTISLLE